MLITRSKPEKNLVLVSKPNVCRCSDAELLKDFDINPKIVAVLFRKSPGIVYTRASYEQKIVDYVRWLHNGNVDRINCKPISCPTALTK